METHCPHREPPYTHGGSSALQRLSRLALPVLLLSLLRVPVLAQNQPGQGYSLAELLKIGREKNPSVLALTAHHAATDADRRNAGRLSNPEIRFEAGTGEPFGAADSRSLRGFSVQQVIENPISRHFRMKARGLEVDASGEDLRSGIADIEYQIRTHFYRVLYLQELVRLNRLNEEALDAIRGLIETRAELGEVRELEAIRLRVEHLRAQNEVRAAEIEMEQFRRHLNTFLGNELPEDYALLGTLTSAAFEPDLAALMAERLPRHPALQRAAMERDRAEAQSKASRLAWLPDPVISGTTAKELDGDVKSLGIGIQFPLWNQSRAATDRDRRRFEAASHLEEALRLELEAQLIIHHNHLRLNRQTLSLFEEGLLAEANASMEIAEISYRQGEISFVEYLDARRTYHSIQIEHQQALYDWNVERAEFDRAVGGGTL